MYFTFEFLLSHTFAIILIWTIGGDCCSTGALESDEDTCCINYYSNGTSCKVSINFQNNPILLHQQKQYPFEVRNVQECPAGYYGINCSDVCSTSYYGIGCTTKCECSPCHHIYGCMLITTFDQTMQRINTINLESMSQTTKDGLKKRVGNTLDATGYRNDIGRILIVSTGSIVSLVLISIIVREIYTYRRFSRTSSP